MNRNDILIEADELLTKIGNPNLRIFDTSIVFFPKDGMPTAHENYKQAHIIGSAFFDHQQFSDASKEYMYMVLPEDKLATQIGNIGIDADSEVILYSTNRLANATRAWWVLHYAGHNNVRVLNGGLPAWKEAGGDIEQGDNHYNPSTFECQLRPHMFVDKEAVQSALADKSINTVYTLDLAIYDGTHITGSSCLPCGNLMDNNAFAFLPNDILADRLKEEAQSERVITYCGGGIAATVNGMAHLMAGNENVAVYDGSLSEWMGEGLPTSNSQTG